MLPTIQLGPLRLYEKRTKIALPADPVATYLPRLQHRPHSFCFDSQDVSPIYGRFSLIGCDPILQITGKDANFSLKVLQPRGAKFCQKITPNDFPQIKNFRKTATQITGTIPPVNQTPNATQPLQKPTSADSLRIFLKKFSAQQKTFLGLYGACAYDFVRLFEPVPNLNPATTIPDFNFFLYDTFLHFDNLKKIGQLICLRANQKELTHALCNLKKNLTANQPPTNFKIKNAQFDLGKKEFEHLVQLARNLAKRGELFEVVFSRTLNAKFRGNPLALFLRYRTLNPAPYLFYFDLGQKEYLIGASPEMMLRVENRAVHARPISGTIARGQNPIEDHENQLKLLASPKERAELDMLIDLGRNDLARICKPGIKITEYRTVEKYSRVFHTIAHLTGQLAPPFTALDAVIATLPVGTLAGAPKVAALQAIEQHEKTRRGYYGGGIGYFTLSGECDTGILIRTAHLKKSTLEFRVGATLLYDSIPQAEFQETEAKAKAFLDLCQQ